MKCKKLLRSWVGRYKVECSKNANISYAYKSFSISPSSHHCYFSETPLLWTLVATSGGLTSVHSDQPSVCSEWEQTERAWKVNSVMSVLLLKPPNEFSLHLRSKSLTCLQDPVGQAPTTLTGFISNFSSSPLPPLHWLYFPPLSSWLSPAKGPLYMLFTLPGISLMFSSCS